MSDSVAGLLFELYETNRATAYSNFLVGIVFGEQLPRSLGKSDQTVVTVPSPPHFPEKNPHHRAMPILGRLHPILCHPRSLHRPLWHVALHSPVSIPFERMMLKKTDGSYEPILYAYVMSRRKKSQRWRAALGPTPVHARGVERDVRARSHSARARNLARLPELRARAQFVE
jgi:hypothetical protein